MDGRDQFFPPPAAAAANQDKVVMNQTMLRFRPIAPKPVTEGSISAYSDLNRNKELVGKRRTKRKYVRVKKNAKSIAKNHSKDKEAAWFDETVATLELLPEVEKKDLGKGEAGEIDNSVVHNPPPLLNFKRLVHGNNFVVLDLTMEDLRFSAVESWVVLECVTEVFGDEGRLGWTDAEKVNNLEVETCPGFVSDGVDGMVKWVNQAYKRMVEAEECGKEVVVWLETKEKIPVERRAFSCRVRVVYGGEGRRGKVVPCDVWRMEFGGFAWRLDVDAALSLGPSLIHQVFTSASELQLKIHQS